ncbi:hypothetical protein CHUAL_007782 [Chamberlinius hualienensis]
MSFIDSSMNINEDDSSSIENADDQKKARKLHVSRVPLDIDEAKFKELFSKCGEITYTKLYRREGFDYQIGKVKYLTNAATFEAFQMYDRTSPYLMVVQFDRYNQQQNNRAPNWSKSSQNSYQTKSVHFDDNHVKKFRGNVINRKIIRSEGYKRELQPIYRGVTVSWEDASKVSFIFSHSDRPGHFWAAENSGNVLYNVLSLTNNICRKNMLQTPSGSSVGDIVAAKQVDGGYWYRAIVVGKVENGWIVQDLDFGDKNLVNDIRHLPLACCQYPALAVYFTLRNPTHFKWVSSVEPKSELTINVLSTADFTKLVDVANGHLCNALSIWSKSLICNHLPLIPENYNSRVEPASNYKLPTRKFELGEKLLVFPTFYKCADGLYVRIVSEESEKIIEMLDKHMNDICEKQYEAGGIGLTEVSVSQFVCAKWEKDGKWYRSEILEVGVNGTVEIRFVDHGDRYFVKTQDLLEIPDIFRGFYALAVPVVLLGGSNDHLEKAYNILITNGTWNMVIADANSLPLHVYLFNDVGQPLFELVEDIVNEENIRSTEMQDEDDLPTRLCIGHSEVLCELSGETVKDSSDTESREMSDRALEDDVSTSSREDHSGSEETVIMLGSSFNRIHQQMNRFVRTKLGCREISRRCFSTLCYDFKYFYESALTAVLPVGEIVTVIFTKVDSPYYMYCWNSDVTDQLTKLSEIMTADIESEIYWNKSCTYFPLADEICAVKCQDDVWYRAACLDTMASDCRFVLIDYGTECVVPYTDIQPINEKFMKIPVQGIFCQFHGIPEEHFEAEDIYKFQNLLPTREPTKIFVSNATFSNCSYSITIPSIESSDFLPSSKPALKKSNL